MWVITRIPDNPITGRGGPISEMAIATEVFQIAYIGMTAVIIAKERVELIFSSVCRFKDQDQLAEVRPISS